MDPANLAALDGLCEAFMDAGLPEQAKMVASRSIALAPDAGAHKWLVLAQTSEGKEALAAYARGSALLEAQLAAASASGDAETSQQLARQVASAYCAVAELFMTDLCFEADAESSCEAAVERGLAAEAENPELLTAFANLRACQQRPAEARPALKRALERMVEAMEAEGGRDDDDDVDDDDDDDDTDVDGGSAAAAAAPAPGAVASSSSSSPAAGAAAAAASSAAAPAAALPAPVLPSFGCRFSAARAAIELSGGEAGLASGVLGPATTVLEGLVLEDEDCTEAWFRLAEAQASAGDVEGAVDTLLVSQRLIVERMGALSSRDLAVGEAGPEAAGGVARAAALDAVAAKLAAIGPEGLPGAGSVGEEAAEELSELHVALKVMNTMGRAVVDGSWSRAGPPPGEDGGAAAAALAADARAAAP